MQSSSSATNPGLRRWRRTALMLATGAAGFVAAHIIVALLNQGYRVRGTVRSGVGRCHVAAVVWHR
jgi:hypothetical protein